MTQDQISEQLKIYVSASLIADYSPPSNTKHGQWEILISGQTNKIKKYSISGEKIERCLETLKKDVTFFC